MLGSSMLNLCALPNNTSATGCPFGRLRIASMIDRPSLTPKWPLIDYRITIRTAVINLRSNSNFFGVETEPGNTAPLRMGRRPNKIINRENARLGHERTKNSGGPIFAARRGRFRQCRFRHQGRGKPLIIRRTSSSPIIFMESPLAHTVLDYQGWPAA